MSSVKRMTVVPEESIGTINPYLHGHFAEHLGELVYSGVWVGEDSKIPNIGGLRTDVIEALKPLHIPVLRWPGGCFADTYRWRDGVGSRETRPMRVNTHWGMAEESNAFGTHEFMAFCKAIGAEPYFAANLGSGSPTEMCDWIEYCNFDGNSTLADERRTNGSSEPFRVKYWGIGNENWGCGGNMTAEEYAANFARYRTYANSYPGAPVEGIGCGPNGSDWIWTRDFLKTLGHRRHMLQGFAAHYYCGAAGTATEYDENQWLELLAKAGAIEGLITGHRAIMDRFDPERRIKLIFDEWGAWHPVEKDKPSGGLYQQNTIRDACVAALTLDIFHNHADKVFMANIAQVINVLQAVLLVQDDQCIKTPTYDVFELYRAHQGGKALRVISEAEAISDGGASRDHCRNCNLDKQPYSLRSVQGSASVKEDMLCVTVVNSHPSEPAELELLVRDATLSTVDQVTLAADDIHAHNTFEHPDRVRLSKSRSVAAHGERVQVTLPAGSVTRLIGKLG